MLAVDDWPGLYEIQGRWRSKRRHLWVWVPLFQYGTEREANIVLEHLFLHEESLPEYLGAYWDFRLVPPQARRKRSPGAEQRPRRRKAASGRSTRSDGPARRSGRRSRA